MQDHIKELCTKLIAAEEPEEIIAVAQELQAALSAQAEILNEGGKTALIAHLKAPQ
jgi:hypothetical protein